MEIINLLDFTDRIELREWLKVNHNRVKSCWVVTSRSKQPTYECIPYIEVVEEALCFGWIDSNSKEIARRMPCTAAFSLIAKEVIGLS